MARIRYLAILCADPTALSRFYQRHFGMAEIACNPAGDITLTDGGFNLTLLKLREGLRELRREAGLHHLGIAVDNLDAVVARYRERYPRGTVIAESGDFANGEVRIHDP